MERSDIRERPKVHSRISLTLNPGYKILGSRSHASEILSRRRPLTLVMIQKITTRWKIPADLLVQPYRISTSAA
jgi:antitoxin component HigA of HigAB toxin-antitoxin module